MEEELIKWAGRLNSKGAEVIRTLKIKGATDITGFGLGGHLLEMARSAKVHIELWSQQVPVLDRAVELAAMGLIPAGSYANKHYCSSLVEMDDKVQTHTADIIFDAQTSGGLVLAVKEKDLNKARQMLSQGGDLAAHIGQVHKSSDGLARLLIN